MYNRSSLAEVEEAAIGCSGAPPEHARGDVQQAFVTLICRRYVAQDKPGVLGWVWQPDPGLKCPGKAGGGLVASGKDSTSRMKMVEHTGCV